MNNFDKKMSQNKIEKEEELMKEIKTLKKNSYNFSIGNISINIKKDKSKTSDKFINNESYLTNEEFKRFDYIKFPRFIKENEKYVLPLIIWFFFSYLKEIKFGNNNTIQKTINNQIYRLTNSIQILLRNGVVGSSSVIEKNIQKENQFYDFIVNHFKNQKELKVSDIINNNNIYIFDFLNTFSEICIIVFSQNNICFEKKIKNISDWHKLVKLSGENDIEEILLNYILSMKIIKVEENTLENEKMQFDNIKKLIESTKEKEIIFGGKNKNKLYKDCLRFIHGSSDYFSLIDIYNYKMMSGDESLIFDIDYKNKKSVMKIRNNINKKRSIENVNDEIKFKKQKIEINNTIDIPDEYIEEIEKQICSFEKLSEKDQSDIINQIDVEYNEIEIKDVVFMDDSIEMLIKSLDLENIDFGKIVDEKNLEYIEANDINDFSNTNYFSNIYLCNELF